MQLMPGFSSAAPPQPQEVAPVPTREDPSIQDAKNKLRQSELRRRGRAAAILAPSEGDLGTPTVARPEARSAQLLGG